MKEIYAFSIWNTDLVFKKFNQSKIPIILFHVAILSVSPSKKANKFFPKSYVQI